MEGEDVFSLAGLWSEWANPMTGEVSHTFTIITTAANEMMAQIHNTKKRMPLILNRDEEKKWIERELNEVEIKNIMKPFDENEMEAYTISKLITQRGVNNNVPEVIEHFSYPEMVK